MQKVKLSETSEIRVERSEFKGKEYLKLRIWHNGTPSYKGGTYSGPDKQGMNLLFDEEVINKLVEAINLEAFGDEFKPVEDKEQIIEQQEI